jgi:hypothetical protein
MWSVPSGYKGTRNRGSNTSIVTLRVVGGDEKGSLESEAVKYGHESYGTRTRKWLRWREPVAIANDRPVLSSERAPHTDRTVTFKQEETSGHELLPGLDTKTDRLADCQSERDFDFEWVIWVLQGRLRRDEAIIKPTVQLWDIRRIVTTWAQKLKNLHCWEPLPSND